LTVTEGVPVAGLVALAMLAGLLVLTGLRTRKQE